MALFGRDAVLDSLEDILVRREHRVVTLVGVGGCGKTTLARAAAERAAPAFAGGVSCTELESVRDPGLVTGAVAASLALPAGPGQTMERVCESLASQETLLVLDNCEHLREACAGLATALVTHCPGVRVLATSREPLGVAGEHTVGVPPLALPGSVSASADELASVASAQLFVARAVAADPSFALTPATAGPVARACLRLDGLPLAIELVAAQLGSMPVEELVARLGSALDARPPGGNGAAARHATMRASMEWTHGMLGAAEAVLLRRLSVFAGGWTQRAAAAVCGDSSLGDDDLDEAHRHLERRRLVLRTGGGERPRYRMLEPVREHAREKLAAAGEAEALSRRFVAHIRDLVERELPDRSWSRPPDLAAVQRLEHEHANLLAAVHEAGRTGDPVGALELTVRLWVYWRIRGHLPAARFLTERFLPFAAEATPTVQVDALLAAAGYAQSAGDYEACEVHVGHALARARDLGDEFGFGTALSIMATVATGRGDHTRAVRLYREALDIADAIGASYGRTLLLTNMALALGAQGEVDEAEEALEEALVLLTWTDDAWFRAYVLSCLGGLARARGDIAKAHESALESAELLVEHAGGTELAEALEHLAALAADLAGPALSVQLYGAADGARQRSGSALSPTQEAAVAADVDALRRVLGEDAFTRHWSAGQQLTPGEAVARARTAPREEPRRPRVAGDESWPLTPREFEVANAVAAGLTNKQIAARLHISAGTAKTHVEHALRKLGFTTRSQLASWATTRQPA